MGWPRVSCLVMCGEAIMRGPGTYVLHHHHESSCVGMIIMSLSYSCIVMGGPANGIMIMGSIAVFSNEKCECLSSVLVAVAVNSLVIEPKGVERSFGHSDRRLWSSLSPSLSLQLPLLLLLSSSLSVSSFYFPSSS